VLIISKFERSTLDFATQNQGRRGVAKQQQQREFFHYSTRPLCLIIRHLSLVHACVSTGTRRISPTRLAKNQVRKSDDKKFKQALRGGLMFHVEHLPYHFC